MILEPHLARDALGLGARLRIRRLREIDEPAVMAEVLVLELRVPLEGDREWTVERSNGSLDASRLARIEVTGERLPPAILKLSYR